MRRILRTLLVAAAVWVTLCAIEWAAFPAVRAARAWDWPVPAAGSLRADRRLGFANARGRERQPDDPLVIVATNRWLGWETDEGRRAELVARLSGQGVLAARVAFFDYPWANTVQRALDFPRVSDAWVVVAMSAEDAARDAAAELAGQPLPRLAARDSGVEAAGLTRPPPAGGLAGGVVRLVPCLRVWLAPVARVPLAGKPGLLPAELWPYVRGGVHGESGRWQQTVHALRLLRDELAPVRSRLIALWIPAPIEADDDSFSRFLAELELDPADVEPSRAARRLADECTRLGIDWLDTSHALQRTGDAAWRLGGAPDHTAVLSDRGRSVVLRRVAEHLRGALAR